MGGETWDFQGIFIFSFMSPSLFHSLGAEKCQPFTIKGKRTNARMGSRVQTHHMSGWPKARIFSKNRQMRDMDASRPQVGLIGWKIVGREL